LPAEAAYCPSCGAPRSEIDHFVRETERAVILALTTGTEALDRAVKDLQPAFDKAVQTLRPAVEAVGKATNDVVVAMTPAAAARKSTRLNSRHGSISYAVFCLKKKNNVI